MTETTGYAPDHVVYHDRLNALAFAEAFMRNDREQYEAIAARCRPTRLAHALSFVVGLLASDWAEHDLDADGIEYDEGNPLDPVYLKAVGELFDELRERSRTGLDLGTTPAAPSI